MTLSRVWSPAFAFQDFAGIIHLLAVWSEQLEGAEAKAPVSPAAPPPMTVEEDKTKSPDGGDQGLGLKM